MAVLEPVHDLQRRVVERLGERLPELVRPRVAAEPGGEPTRRMSDEQPPPSEAHQERHARQRDHEGEYPQPDLDGGRVGCELPQDDRRRVDPAAEAGDGQHGRDRAAHEAGRSADPLGESHGDRHVQQEEHHFAQRADEVLDDRRFGVRHHERVAGAVGLSSSSRVPAPGRTRPPTRSAETGPPPARPSCRRALDRFYSRAGRWGKPAAGRRTAARPPSPRRARCCRGRRRPSSTAS